MNQEVTPLGKLIIILTLTHFIVGTSNNMCICSTSLRSYHVTTVHGTEAQIIFLQFWFSWRSKNIFRDDE